MSFVYVIQDFGDKNLVPARKYGKVRVLLPPNRQVVFSSAPTVQVRRRERGGCLCTQQGSLNEGSINI